MSEVMHIPDGWEIDIVENLAEIITGDKDTQDKLEDGKYPFYVRSNTVERINTYSFDGEAILTAGDGVGVGKVFHHVDGKFDFHQRVYCIFNFSERLSPKYFFEYFRKNFIARVNKYSAKGSVDSVRYEMISLMEIPVPPIIEQQKIAKILSTLDKAMEASQKLIAKEKNIKKGLMHDLLINGIDENGKIRSPQTHEYKESELGLIPEGWEVDNLKSLDIELIDGDRGNNYPKSEDFLDYGYCLFLSAKNVTKQGFRFNKLQFISQNKDKVLGKGKLKRGDFVLTTRGTVGNIVYYSDCVQYEHIRINSGMIILRNNNSSIEREYFYKFLQSEIFEKQILNTVFGSAQPQLTVKEIEKFLVKFPKSLDEQKKIVKILTTQNKKIETEEKNLAKLQELKKGLMGDLLNGKVRVKM